MKVKVDRYRATTFHGATFYRAYLTDAPSWQADGPTHAAAVAGLREVVAGRLNDDGHTVIVCKDGTVIVAEHDRYASYRDGRYCGSSIYGPDTNRREVAEHARQHAEQSYGGVVWSAG